MATHLHFLRLNPVAPRTRKPAADVYGIAAWLFVIPALLFWATWILKSVLLLPGPFNAIFAANLPERAGLYLLSLGFPLAALILGLFSLNQRRRRNDLGLMAVPLSLILLGAGLLYGLLRVI